MPFKLREHKKAYDRQRKEQLQKLLEEMKCQPCADCGVSYPHYVMEFDHVPERGKKKFNVINGNAINTRTLEELAKCDVVCGNCHNTRSYFRRMVARM